MVDDEAHVRHILEAFLTRDGYEVALATNADEAVELLAIRPFAAILSDYVMEGRPGIELLAETQQDHPHLVRLLLTGRSRHDFKPADLEAAGIDEIIEKPFERKHLLDTLRRVIAEKQ